MADSADQRDQKTEAKKLYTQACDEGEWLSCGRLAKIESAAGNKDQEKTLLTKACNADFIPACTNLGYNEQVTGHAAEAKAYLQKACDAHDDMACFDLGDLFKSEGKLADAKKNFKLACDNKNMHGCYNLGNELVDAGNKKDGLILIKQACDGGNPSACNAIDHYDRADGKTKTHPAKQAVVCDDQRNSPRPETTNLGVFSLCDKKGADCVEARDLKRQVVYIRPSSRVNLVALAGQVDYWGSDISVALLFDPQSICDFKVFSKSHAKAKAAIVSKGKF